MARRTRLTVKALSILLSATILLGLLPPKLAQAQTLLDTGLTDNHLYLPLVQQPNNWLPGPDSPEYQNFEAHVKAVMATVKVSVSDDGSVHIQADPALVSAAGNEEDRKFFQDVATLISLIQTGQFKMSANQGAPLPDEVQGSFSWVVRSDRIGVVLNAPELMLLYWAASDALTALVGVVVFVLIGNWQAGVAITWAFKHFLETVLKNNTIGSGFGSVLMCGIYKRDLKGWFNNTPFFLYSDKPGIQCLNRWRRWWLKWSWGWYITPDSYCWT